MADTQKTVQSKKLRRNGGPVRLYTKGVFTGFKTSKRNQYENQAFIRIQGVQERADAAYYMGKRVAYIYKAEKEVQGSKFRVRWGRVMGTHGTNGLVRVKFAKNLPSRAMGCQVRVMMYPNRAQVFRFRIVVKAVFLVH